MTTLSFALVAVAAFLLWRRKADWAWMLVLVALLLGVKVFVGDVDFSSQLGIQL